MKRRHNEFTYWLELQVIRLRDLVRSPARVLRECGVRPGMTVLDFGCGPGGFSLAAARLVGPAGRVCALDIQPLAIESVRSAAARRNVNNIQPIHADRIAEVPEDSVDVALLYDVLHIDPDSSTQAILSAIHRVLKPAGVLSVSDHHLRETVLLPMVTRGGLFRSTGHSRRTIQFVKVPVRKEAT